MTPFDFIVSSMQSLFADLIFFLFVLLISSLLTLMRGVDIKFVGFWLDLKKKKKMKGTGVNLLHPRLCKTSSF